MENAVETITTSSVFEQGKEVLNGVVGIAGDFFTTLWAQPMGKIVIGMTVAGAGLGLCYKLFLRKRHI